jgi:hypothetical protein
VDTVEDTVMKRRQRKQPLPHQKRQRQLQQQQLQPQPQLQPLLQLQSKQRLMAKQFKAFGLGKMINLKSDFYICQNWSLKFFYQ